MSSKMIHKIKKLSLTTAIEKEGKNLSNLMDRLKDFLCSDIDIKSFLHNSAIQYEQLSKARTYLLLDEADNAILGYFTLSTVSIELGKNIPKDIKEALGYDENIKSFGYKKNYIPAYLLALVGKDKKKYNKYLEGKYGANYIAKLKDKYGKDDYKNYAEKLFDTAMPHIEDAVRCSKVYTGGQILYLDCECIDPSSTVDSKLIKLYKDLGFIEFDRYSELRNGKEETYIRFMKDIRFL